MDNEESMGVNSWEPWSSEGTATTLHLVPQLFPVVWLVMGSHCTNHRCCACNSRLGQPDAKEGFSDIGHSVSR